MKFSIIIPVYNTEKYIVECLDSIINQTYDNWEVIIIDDGSTDTGGIICDEYAKLFPNKVKVIHKENEGVIVARYCGVKEIAGDIVMFVDSDDCLRSDALSLLKDVFYKENSDIVMFNSSVNQDFVPSFIDYDWPNNKIFYENQKHELYKVLITSSKLNTLWSKAFKKEIVEDLKVSEIQQKVKYGEDLLTLLSFFTKAKQISLCDQNLHYYRQREESAIRRFDLKRKNSIKIVHSEMEKYIELWEVEEYKEIHCSRKVKGWINLLIILLKNKEKITPKEYNNELISMANDEYFLNAYKNMDKKELNKYQLYLSKLLFLKKYNVINLYGWWIRMISRRKYGR